MNLAPVLELQEQPVGAGIRELGLELDRPSLAAGAWRLVPSTGAGSARVNMQEGEIAVTQRDQVAAGSQVGLRLDRSAWSWTAS